MRRITADILAAITAGTLLIGSPLWAQGRKVLKSFAAPTGITFQASGSDVTVAWAAPPGAVSYRVLRSPSPTTAGTDIAAPMATTSMTDRSLTPGATYYYQIVAVYPGGEQAPSSPMAYTAPPLTVVARTPPRPLGQAVPVPLTPVQPIARAMPSTAGAPSAGIVGPRTLSLPGFTASGMFSNVGPRTIALAGFTASGAFTNLGPRTITLSGFTASGIFTNVGPRTIALSGFTASGIFTNVGPRTIALSGFAASGIFTNVGPRTIALAGWTGVGN